jgi:hypothetical protein
LAVASDIVGRFSPAAFGGPARNMTGPMKPYWFKDNYLFQTDVSEARFLNSDECWKIVGLNMFFRHDLINLIGGFDPRLGMCGERIAYGEESAFLRRVAELEPDRIYFDPRLYVNDLTRPEKLQLGYTLRASFGAGRSSYHMKSYAQLPGRHFQILMEATVKCFSFMVTLARVPIYRDREQYPFIQNFIYEAGADFMRQLGYLYEQHRHFSQNRRRIKHLPDNKRMLSEKS